MNVKKNTMQRFLEKYFSNIDITDILKSNSPKKRQKKLDHPVKKLTITHETENIKKQHDYRFQKIKKDNIIKKEFHSSPKNKQKLTLDFEKLINQKKFIIEKQKPKPYTTSEYSKIYVCVRKRPIFEKEINDGEIDCISAINPEIYIYDCKYKIDGYTKYIDANKFKFDSVFNENDNTKLLYKCSIEPSLNILYKGGVVTCFAYGQTGSGKTYTMKGIQNYSIDNIFENFYLLSKQIKRCFKFYISFFEIYSGRLYDLLNNRNKVLALEDKNQKVQIFGLTQKEIYTSSEMKNTVNYANNIRTTHDTVTNETSSRSHAICNFIIKFSDTNKEYAKLILVDLAGSERATETQSNDKERLQEGAEINKSLLALKECIRGLDARKKGNLEKYVPFRNSKLTLVLRDSFLGDSDLCKIIMITCVSPSNKSANHSINTLRYADRLKEKSNVQYNGNCKKIIKKSNFSLKKNNVKRNWGDVKKNNNINKVKSAKINRVRTSTEKKMQNNKRNLTFFGIRKNAKKNNKLISGHSSKNIRINNRKRISKQKYNTKDNKTDYEIKETKKNNKFVHQISHENLHNNIYSKKNKSSNNTISPNYWNINMNYQISNNPTLYYNNNYYINNNYDNSQNIKWKNNDFNASADHGKNIMINNYMGTSKDKTQNYQKYK